MPVFESADKLYRCLGGFFELMGNHPETQGLLQTTELNIRFVFTDPEASITWLPEKEIHPCTVVIVESRPTYNCPCQAMSHTGFGWGRSM